MERSKFLIDKLNLIPHPEGGYYKEIYRADEIIPKGIIDDFSGNRNLSTSIYYMLVTNDVSHLHKIKSDEIWHFYEGSAIIIHLIKSNGNYEKFVLGNNPPTENFQVIIPKNNLFAAELKDKSSYALVGCTVAPGFHFDDFTLAERNRLIEDYPKLKKLILKFT